MAPRPPQSLVAEGVEMDVCVCVCPFRICMPLANNVLASEGTSTHPPSHPTPHTHTQARQTDR